MNAENNRGSSTRAEAGPGGTQTRECPARVAACSVVQRSGLSVTYVASQELAET